MKYFVRLGALCLLLLAAGPVVAQQPGHGREIPAQANWFLTLDPLLQAARQHNMGEKEEDEIGGWIRNELERHWNPDAPTDYTTLYDAALQRDQMAPAAHLGSPGPESLGGSWEYIGPNDLGTPYQQYFGIEPLAGRVSATAYHPTDPNQIYAGGGFGGLFRSTNGGFSWDALTDGWTQLHVSSIAVDPNHPDWVYVGTGDFSVGWPLSGFTSAGFGYGMGIMKSTDRGLTWDYAFNQISRAAFANDCISSISVNPADSSVILVTTGRGVSGGGDAYWTVNGGSSWTPVSNGTVPWSTTAIGIPDGTGERWLYMAGHGTNAFAQRKTGGSLSWTVDTLPPGVTSSGSVLLAASATNANTLYCLVSSSGANAGIYRSTNNGDTWSSILGNYSTGYNFNQAGYNDSLLCTTDSTGTKDVLYCGEIDISVNLDARNTSTWASIGGPTFTNAAVMHNDQQSIAVHPTDPNTVLLGSDGGLVTYEATSGTITRLNSRLPNTLAFSVALHPDNGIGVLTGLQDNGTATCLGLGGEEEWQDWANLPGPLGGDGGTVAIGNSALLQYGFANQDPIMTKDQWTTSERIVFNSGGFEFNNEPRAWVVPFEIDPNNNTLAYMLTNRLWRWNSNTEDWTQFTQAIAATGGGTAVAISEDGTYVYTGASNGEIWRLDRVGNTWRQLNAGLPGRWVSSVSVNPTNKKDITIGFATVAPTSGAPNLWRCADTAAGSLVWTPVNSGTSSNQLPLVPVNDIVRDPDDPVTTWYVATDIGVFETINGGSTWTSATRPLGLPNVQVNDLEISVGQRRMAAATFGRGIWQIDLPGIEGSLDIAENTVSEGGIAHAQMNLLRASPANGYTFALSCDPPGAVNMPSHITIPGGASYVTFDIQAANLPATTPVTITATLGGTVYSDSFTIEDSIIAAFDISEAEVWGGTDTANGYVQLWDVAPEGGVTLDINSSQPSSLQAPSTVFIPEGQNQGSFLMPSFTVNSSRSVTVSVSYQGVGLTDSVIVKPNRISVISANPGSVYGGTDHSSLYIQLDTVAPSPGGYDVALASSDPSSLSVPATVHVPGGGNQAVATLTSHNVNSVRNVTITASLNGASSVTSVEVKPIRILVFDITPGSVHGGTDHPSLYIQLEQVAPPGGLNVVLQNNDAGALQAPSVVHIAGGQNQASVQLTSFAVSTDRLVTLTGTLNAASMQDSVLVQRILVDVFTINPSDATGGLEHPGGYLQLNDVAPTPAGSTILLSSSKPSVASVPSIAFIAAGQNQASFVVTTTAVTTVQPVIISATLNGVTRQSTLYVHPNAVTISGIVEFDGLSDRSLQPNPVTFEFRQPGTLNVITTRTATLDANGAYSFVAPLVGSADMAIKEDTWLRRTILVDTTPGYGYVDFTLVNGDVDGDNEVSIGDYAVLSQSYGSYEGAPNWDPNADLDRDGEVSIGDFAILSANYGQVGDN